MARSLLRRANRDPAPTCRLPRSGDPLTTDSQAGAGLSAAGARRAARNASAIAAARILSNGAQFGWQLILGRLLGEVDFGVYGTVGALFAVGVAVTSFSMSLIVIRDVARYPDRAGGYLTASLVSQTLLALVAYVGINAAAWALGYSDTIRAFIAIAGLSLFIDMLGNLSYDQLLAQERMVATSAVEVGHILLRIALAGVALWLGFGLLGVYVMTILTGFGRAGVLWALLRRTGVRPRWPLEWTLARPLLINSAPLALSTFISMIYLQLDRLMTTSILTEADTGHLNAAFVINYGVIDLLSTTVLVAIYPLMSRAYTDSGARDLYRLLVEKLAFFTLLIGLPVGLVFTAFATEITVPLFGANFAPAAAILRVLIWYTVVTIIANVFAQNLMVQNRQRYLLAVRAAGLGFKLLLNLILLPRIGVIGAAFASVSAELLVLGALASGFGLNWRGTQIGRWARLALIVIVTAGAMLALGALHPLLGMIGGGLIYGLGIIIGGVLAADDWDLLYRLAAALPGSALIRRVWRRDVQINW
ncbi:MAG: flippase [Chloroflexi bacterium]|nr:flippase [Chloroflexota bacterium]